MCKPASFIATKDNMFWNLPEDGESHIAIRKKYNLRDDIHKIVGVNIEITPPTRNGKHRYMFNTPLDKWVFSINSDIPDWWNPDEVEKAARAELPHWLHAHTITDDCEINNGYYILTDGAPTINLCGGILYVYNDTNATIINSGGMIEVYDISNPVISHSSGSINIWDDAIPEIQQRGGNICIRNTSEAILKQYDGWCHVYNNCKPTIEQYNGGICIYDYSEPVIKQYDGEIHIWDNAKPNITHISGNIYEKDNHKLSGDTVKTN